MTHAQPNLLTYVIPILVILPILYFRLRRLMKPMPLKLNRMWIRPAIILCVGIAVLAAAPPPARDWFWFALAALLGAVLGWQWGKQMAIHVDPENGTLMTRGSQAALIMMGLLIVVRVGLRAGVRMESAALHLDATMITDLSIVFAATLFGLRGLEMFLRARQVLAQTPQSRSLPKA
ncbi:MAG TPA: hypothetical protein VH019_06685 [Rhizomicrobium sp.]|jgi:hypothetical protein|nr:hypothetical protein [Rhizomicrobium sp.]